MDSAASFSALHEAKTYFSGESFAGYNERKRFFIMWSSDMLISFSLPESQFIAESPEAVTQKIRMYAALGLYQSGELSIGAASELAGVDRYEFLDFCKHEDVTLHTQTPEELEAEFKKFNTEK